MNPLLNRLFEDRSKSKTRRLSLQRDDHARSFDKALVPKIPTKARFQLLPQVNVDKRNVPRVFVGKLPSINLKTQQMRQADKKHINFRNRKLSTSIRDVQSNFFSTELQQHFLITQNQPREQFINIFKQKKNQIQNTESKPQEDQHQQQLFQYLKVIQNNEDLNQQFCYMNRKDLPYSFFIVDYEDRNKHQYLTVSLRGITYYKDDENEFYTIRKFKKQLEQYKKLKKIGFFKNYLVEKIMIHWKYTMIRKKFNMKCKYLASNLFSQNIICQKYLHFLHSLGQDYAGGNFYNFNIVLTKTLEQFKQVASLGVKQLLKSIKKFDNLIQKTLKNTLQTLLSKFRAEQRVTLGSSDKKRQQQPYLPFDAKRRVMKYTQMAKLKQFELMMYKLMKYTDQYRFNTKIALVQKCYQNSIQLFQNLKYAYENKENMRFTNWIIIHVNIIQNQQRGCINVQPSLQQISSTIISIKQQFLKDLFRDHRLLIDKKQEMFCQNLQLQDQQQKASKYQLKSYIQKSPQIQALNSQLLFCIKSIILDVQVLINKYNTILVQIYNKNIMNEHFENHLDNQTVKQYLEKYREEYQIISNCEQTAEFALAIIKITQMKQIIKNGAEEKYKIISKSIPGEVIRRCENLETQIRNVHSCFKENPFTVEEYINFNAKFNLNKHKIEQIEGEIDKLLEFEQVVYRYGIRIGETVKLNISQIQSLFKELFKRYQEIQQNEQNERKKFQQMVDQMLPFIQQKSEQMLKEIKEDSIINNLASQLPKSLGRLTTITNDYQKIKIKKDELFNNQNQLKLGHKQMEMFEKLELCIHYLTEIWKARQYYFTAQNFIKSKGYKYVNEFSLEPLLLFVNNYDNYSTVLQCFELLQEFKVQIANLLKIIKISQLISAETLMPEHVINLKRIIKSHHPNIHIDHLFTKEGKASITCEQLYLETNSNQIEAQISQIVFLSAQQNIVKNQLLEIEDYWKKNKVKLCSQDLAQNQNPILHLDLNEDLHQKLGYFIVMLKNIEASPNIIGLARDRASINLKNCLYLRSFLWKWSAVERQWIKLLPLMTNCPAVKHQSNVYFDFTSVDSNIRKLVKLVNEMSTLRRICEDSNQKRYLNIIKDCEQQLKEINKVFYNFLESKRSTYGRFYFLSDNELINIFQHVKDARTMSKYVHLCFNCDQLELDHELMSGMCVNQQIFKTRKAILKGQTEQIFKHVEQSMKNSVKSQIKTVVPKLKVSPNVQEQLRQYSLQVCLVADKVFWTEMSQYYLNTTSYDSYSLLYNNISNEMAQLLSKIEKGLWYKLAIRMMHMLSLKQIALELVRDQITVNDFKWKEQIRFYIIEEEIVVNQFDNKLIYGCEYHPPGNVDVPTLSTTRFLYEAYYSCVSNKTLVIQGEEGQGKRQLIHFSGVYYGSYQKQIICNSRLSKDFIMKLVQGALSTGAWLSFYQFDLLNFSVCADLLQLIRKANSVQYRNQQYLFMMIQNKSEFKPISIYSFNYFAVYEPERQKICEYLLKIYGFKKQEDLSKKILKFIKQVRPFLDRIMGSQLALIRKIIEKAGEKRLLNQVGINENELVAEAIRSQIISKQRENKSNILNKAVSSYFNVESQPNQIQDKFHQKLETLCQMINSKTQNIILLGQRSCKSTLIEKSLTITKKEAIHLNAEATDNFFSGEAMQYMRNIPKNKILIYDSNNILSEWLDLISTGYLFIEGKKIILQNNIIMEQREINNCSPSFVDRCKILYLGESIITKWEKFHRILKIDNCNYRFIKEIIQQLFGEDLENITEINLIVIANILKNYKQTLSQKSVQKLIVWIIAVLGQESIWSRYFGGKHSDFTLMNSQLVSIDINKISPVSHKSITKFLIIPTKTNVHLIDFINILLKQNIFMLIEGPPQSGKSSLLQLITKKYALPSNKPVSQWGQSLKHNYTFIRKEGKNLLVDIEIEGHKIIVVDDLDLSGSAGYQYLRVLAEKKIFRDKHFNQYVIQNFKLIACSRQIEKKGKFWSNYCTLPFRQMNKEAVQTIFRYNLNKQINEFSMNRQTQQFINGSLMKSISIAHDDLTNIIGTNQTSVLLLGVLKNMLSLPKKQGYISVQNYTNYFKSHFIAILNQKSTNKRLQWQIKTVYENIFKVILPDLNPNYSERFIYSDGQFLQTKVSQIEQLAQKHFPHLVCFQKLIENIIYLLNQFRCIDNNIIILGKRGTGKKLLLQICSKLSDIPLFHDRSDAINAAVQNKKIIFIDQIEENLTFYEQLQDCMTDKDLQKLIQPQKRQQYSIRVAGQDASQRKILQKCKSMIMFALTCDKTSFEQFSSRNRSAVNMPLCFIEQWPPEALVDMYSVNDPYPKMHAEIFTEVNKILTNYNYGSLTLRIFQKYLKLYGEIYNRLNSEVQNKIQLLSKIHFKFNESSSMISAWQDRVDILRFQIQGTIKKSKDTILVNKLFNFALSIFYQQISAQETKVAQSTNQLKNLNSEIQKKIVLIEKVLKKIEKIVSSFQRTQLGQLKKVYKLNRLISFGVSCLCILFGEQNVDQKAIHRILADPNLLMKMKDPELLSYRNTKLQSKFNKQFASFQTQFRNSTNQLAKTLIQWLRCIIEYWQTNNQHKLQEQRQQIVKASLEKSTQKHEELILQANNTTKQIQERDGIIKHFEAIQQQKEEQLKLICQRLIIAQKIIPILKNQQQQTKINIKQLGQYKDNLRGNSILTAFTASFLPMQSLIIKQRLLQMVKKILKSNIICFSKEFMATISGQKIDSLQSLNYFLLISNKMGKIIIDPNRKCLNYLEENSHLEMRENIIQNAQQKIDLQENKIYHCTTLDIKDLKEKAQKYLIIDWGAISLQEKQQIFLRLAQFHKPQYFNVKAELETQISKNLAGVRKLKQELYQIICERQMKIIDDQTFVQNGQKLQKLQIETQKLKQQTSQKMNQITQLTKVINGEVSQIICIYEKIKVFRKMDLQILLNVCCQTANAVQTFLQWCLANLHENSRTPFLISIIIALNQGQQTQILKDLINQIPLKLFESKIKKPQFISSKHWDIVGKLSNYSSNFKRLYENIYKFQRQFQEWCIHPLQADFPYQIGVQLSFVQKMALLYYFKPKVAPFLINQIIPHHLKYDLSPLTNQRIIEMMNSKFPIVFQGKLDWLTYKSKQLNDGRSSLVRISKLNGEADMKNIIWKCMEGKQWMICFDIQNKKDLKIVQEICYYVMNYDKQPGFRVFIIFNNLQVNNELLLKKSSFLESYSSHLYEEDPSVDTFLQQNPLEYQISHNTPRSAQSNKLIFNKMYKLIVICYTVIRLKYPQFRKLPLRRIIETMNYIKFKNFTVEFNVFTITQYLSKMMSHLAPNPNIRKQIQQLWDYIIEERKFNDDHFLGIPFDEQKYHVHIKKNHHLIGCQESFYIRKVNKNFIYTTQLLNNMLGLYGTLQEILVLVRTQLGRLPNLITNKNFSSIFNYYYQAEIELHNQKVKSAKNLLQEINKIGIKQEDSKNKSEYDFIIQIINTLSVIFCIQITTCNIKTKLTDEISRLRRQHEFLLYFNPNLPTLVIDPNLISNLEMLLASYSIDYLNTNLIKNGQKWTLFLEFTQFQSQMELSVKQGLYITHLEQQEFIFNKESNTLDPSYEIDGLQKCPIVRLKMRQQSTISQQLENIEIQLESKRGKVAQLIIICSSAYRQWGLREPKLIIN